MTIEIDAYEALEAGMEKSEATLGLLNQIEGLADAVKGYAKGNFDTLAEWGIDRKDINSQTWSLCLKMLAEVGVDCEALKLRMLTIKTHLRLAEELQGRIGQMNEETD